MTFTLRVSRTESSLLLSPVKHDLCQRISNSHSIERKQILQVFAAVNTSNSPGKSTSHVLAVQFGAVGLIYEEN